MHRNAPLTPEGDSGSVDASKGAGPSPRLLLRWGSRGTGLTSGGTATKMRGWRDWWIARRDPIAARRRQKQVASAGSSPCGPPKASDQPGSPALST